jgi:hypothetical protein
MGRAKRPETVEYKRQPDTIESSRFLEKQHPSVSK